MINAWRSLHLFFRGAGGGENRSEDVWTASVCVPWEQVTQIRFKRINKWGGGAVIAEIAARRMLPLVVVKLNIVTVCSHGQKYPSFIKGPLQLEPGLRFCRLEPYFGQTFQKNDSVGGMGILYRTCRNINTHERNPSSCHVRAQSGMRWAHAAPPFCLPQDIFKTNIFFTFLFWTTWKGLLI